jgi:ankyrin repeat protein
VESDRSPEEQLRDAIQRGDSGAVRRLLASTAALRARIDEPAFSFDAPAIVACAGDLAMVDVLLEFGADPNRRSEWWAGGFHALHSATAETAERLIAAGAVPDTCAAAHLDRVELLSAMLAEDSSRVHERGGGGQTPLHFARSRAVIDLLLSAGADIDARDIDHRSTAAEWMLAGRKGAGRYDLARYLVERGASADIFLAAALGLTAKVREMLASDAALLDLRTGQGVYGEQPPSSYHIYYWTIGPSHSPLEVAVQFGEQATVDAMLAFASPRHRYLHACRRGDGAQARALLREHPGLHAAMNSDDHRAITDAAWAGNASAVELMLQLGFDPATPGADSGTALHCAAWQGSTETVAMLLRDPGARSLIHARDAHHGATPLGWCCHGSRFGNTSHDHAGVAKLLLGAGARRGEDTREASPAVEAVLAGAR